VLISSNTFSAGEECAYDLHEQKRATLIGEPTRGGANPGSNVVIGHELVAFIPFARAINPMTYTNWEHVGVKPDISVAASKAERTAYAMVLKALISTNNDPEQRNGLEKVLLQIESETGIPPDTLPPH
jgi:C-terminal processing protease CtpA/Prc